LGREEGFSFSDITHVFLTHIHLDHAGAAGFLARQGATICVHPVGAPHMLNPERLLASATRIYGDKMDTLWGEFLSVPEDRLKPLEDGESVSVGGIQVKALHTSGHAEHHIAYAVGDICFTGDIGGVRMPGYSYVRLPLVPPELHLEKWRASLERLQGMGFRRVAPTHFGIFDDADAHFRAALAAVDETSRWLDSVMPKNPSLEELGQMVETWLHEQGLAAGVSEEVLQTYEIANPVYMSATGLARYWRKFRQPQQ
jgi:glyoxylase-like metal-dependent hydrolase (beta-lactamase superfamily II)